MRYVLAVITALFVAGCSMTLPVRGQLQGSPESFTGSATGYMDGGGHLTVVTTNGARCSGDFVYINNRQGEGTFTCDDGRTGPFSFSSTRRRGTGYGDLGGQRFTFTFGG